MERATDWTLPDRGGRGIARSAALAAVAETNGEAVTDHDDSFPKRNGSSGMGDADVRGGNKERDRGKGMKNKKKR